MESINISPTELWHRRGDNQGLGVVDEGLWNVGQKIQTFNNSKKKFKKYITRHNECMLLRRAKRVDAKYPCQQ